MEEDAKSNQRYNYIVGIDFGTYSTSFSYVHVDYKDDIQTITDWNSNKNNEFGGRVASSVIYKQESSIPLWGGSAQKECYDKKDDFFYAPHIRLYLIDAENQAPLPGNLTPVKLVSDYLKQFHEYGVNQLKTYFQKINEENEIERNSEIDLNKENNRFGFNVTEDQIRYIFSYPDNQADGDYRMQIIEALDLAGIIKSDDDPDDRLAFIPESEAAAYFCLNHPGRPLQPSQKLYLVCDISDEGLGFSTIQAEDIVEAGTVIAHTEFTAVGCGSLEIDKSIKKYLEQKITASSEDNTALKQIRQNLFDFFIKEIKLSFSTDDSSVTTYIYNTNDVDADNSTIQSEYIEDGDFIFSYKEMKKYIFDPITDTILESIEKTIKHFRMGICGIFLSGAIGQDDYLMNLIDEKFGTAELWVHPVKDRELVVSKGLVYSGIREQGLMIPYFESSDKTHKSEIRKPGSGEPVFASSALNGAKKLNHKNIDYIIGLDFGTTYSGFSYAVKPTESGKESKDHMLLIKEIKAWPEQPDGDYPKIPTMLYYSQKMEYLNKFGHEAKGESIRRKENGVLLRYLKFLLSRDSNPIVDKKIMKNLNDFDIVGAIVNFLADFNKEGVSRMKSTGLSVDENRLGYVVTIPATWSDESKSTMKAAVKRAGIVKAKYDHRDFDERVIFITEAEAAVLYCKKYYKDEFSMELEQRFMICDAGGGTVDLTTFEVGQEWNSIEGVPISEVTSSVGDYCGSIYLDEHFKEYILDKFIRAGAEITEKGITNLLDQFAREIKTYFEPSLDPEIEDEIRLQIPLSLDLPSDFEDSTGFIQDNEIVVPYADMENEVFKPVVDQVLNLIDLQLRKLPEGERQLDAILLVGGFGHSPYLHQKIKERFENKAIGAVFIGKPPNGDLAVCRGAVSFGLGFITFPEIITRYAYGLQVKTLCRKLDYPQERMIGYDNEIYCQNAFFEILSKESRIRKGDVYIIKTFIIYPSNPIFAFYSIGYKVDPKNVRGIIATHNLQSIYKLIVKIPEVPGIKEGDRVEFDVIFEIMDSDINAEVLYKGRILTKEVVTKSNTTFSKRRFESGPVRKKRWRASIFSLSG